MKIFAIGDLHLSMGEDIEKPMDIFGGEWVGHAEKLYNNWTESVTNDDIVIVCGDISWGLRLDEAVADLEWIHNLPGTKVFFKGNHDLWWQSAGRLNKMYDDGTMNFMQCKAYIAGDVAICGSRGWICPGTDGFSEHDRKIYDREAARLRLSLEEGKKQGIKKIIGVLHYPPTNDKHQASDFTRLMEEYGVKTCVYGHLHVPERIKGYI